MKISRRSVLIIVDVQKGWDKPVWGKRNNPDAEENISKILDFWRKNGLFVAYCKHDSLNPKSPLYPGQDGNEIKELVKPRNDEKVFIKHVNSCFIGTDLEKWIRDIGGDELYFCGITTQHCVSTTARMAGNLGFKNYVIEDATVSFDINDSHGNHYDAEEVHRINLVSIEGEFSEIISTKDILDAYISE